MSEHAPHATGINMGILDMVEHPLGEYHAGAPLDRIHIDILGPIKTSQDGNVYILMLVDQFTKWLECWPLPNQTAV